MKAAAAKQGLEPVKLSNPDYLTNLVLFADQEAQVLICFREECEYALCVEGPLVTTHLRDKHNIPEEARKCLTRFLKSLPQPNLRDPNKATPGQLAAGSIKHQGSSSTHLLRERPIDIPDDVKMARSNVTSE
ncbi:hypothetical protein EDB80DRAFT_673559 [Ilyonectria destructans]|nr:hypothetical protein EDB80DRAFT_673559 [Ilyonectria destructans]